MILRDNEPTDMTRGDVCLTEIDREESRTGLNSVQAKGQTRV